MQIIIFFTCIRNIYGHILFSKGVKGMLLLSIGFAPEKFEMHGKLDELSVHFKDRGIDIELLESDNGDLHFVKCIIPDDDALSLCLPEVTEAFNIYVSNMLYDIIAEEFEEKRLKKIIKENFYYFSPDEIEYITGRCLRIISGSDADSGEDYSLYLNRKGKIVEKIYEYIIENNEIILEGFLRFRMKEFNSDLEEIVDRVAEEYLVEREYDEFIKLLKYFVEIQDSRIDTINIVIGKGGGYSIYDGSYDEITGEMLKEITGEALTPDISCDDLLVSSLISLAPRYIIIHNISNARNGEIIDTIKNVFSDRVRICDGCDLCLSRPKNRI